MIKTILNNPSRPQEIFISSVLPLAKNMFLNLSRNHNLSVGIYIDSHKIFSCNNMTVLPNCVTIEESEPSLECMVQALLIPMNEDVSQIYLKFDNLPLKGKVQKCNYGRTNYVNRWWHPGIGHIIIHSRSDSALKSDSDIVKSLNEASSLIIYLLIIITEWHFMAESITHEIGLATLPLFSSAERLQYIARNIEKDNLDNYLMEINNLANNMFFSTQLSGIILENVLNYLSQEKRYQRKAGSITTIKEPKFVKIELKQFLIDMLDLLEFKAREKRLKFITINLSGSKIYIMADTFHLKRLFFNILNNALKFSYSSVDLGRLEPGLGQRFIKIEVRDRYDKEGKNAAVIIQNYGIGLEKGEERLIRLPGYRCTHAIRENKVGSGIGLSEAEKILKMHQGKLKINTRALGNSIDGNKIRPFLFTVTSIFTIKEKVDG